MAIALPKDRQVDFDADSAQRYLLSPGDQFFVPPNNVYRLENHSNLKASKLFWAIIKVRKSQIFPFSLFERSTMNPKSPFACIYFPSKHYHDFHKSPVDDVVDSSSDASDS